MENIFAKAQKLLALVNHVATPEQERSVAWSTLLRLLQKNGITLEQLRSEKKVEQAYKPLNDDDQKLIIQCVAVILSGGDFDAYQRRSDKALLIHLTEAQHILLGRMLAHYRYEFTKSLVAIDSEVRRCKAELDNAKKTRKFAMKGFFYAMRLFPETDTQKEDPNPKRYTKEEEQAIIDAMAKCTRNKFKDEQVKIENQSA